jgi:hypothetical protein
MFIMCCTIKSDLRRLEAATIAAVERRRYNQNQQQRMNELNGAAGLQPSAAASFGTIFPPENKQHEGLNGIGISQTAPSPAIYSESVLDGAPLSQTRASESTDDVSMTGVLV